MRRHPFRVVELRAEAAGVGSSSLARLEWLGRCRDSYCGVVMPDGDLACSVPPRERPDSSVPDAWCAGCGEG